MSVLFFWFKSNISNISVVIYFIHFSSNFKFKHESDRILVAVFGLILAYSLHVTLKFPCGCRVLKAIA